MKAENLLPIIYFVSFCDSWSRHIIYLVITLAPTHKNEQVAMYLRPGIYSEKKIAESKTIHKHPLPHSSHCI
jgi:hypothetical protein